MIAGFQQWQKVRTTQTHFIHCKCQSIAEDMETGLPFRHVVIRANQSCRLCIIMHRSSCHAWFFFFHIFSQWFRACLHAGGGPQRGEVTRLRWGNPPVHIISPFNLITFTWYSDRWSNTPHVTSPIWGPPPLCKQYPWAYETCLYYLIICIQLWINI